MSQDVENAFRMQVTLEQCGFELRGSTYRWIVIDKYSTVL